MAATVAHKKALQEIARTAQAPSDLLPLLYEANLIDLQEFVVNQIKAMSSERARSVYYQSASINDIFPDDLQQHILTFLNVNQNRTVCQSWNRFNRQNEENMIRTACLSAKSRPSSEIWILHQNRDVMIPVEIRTGCKGIMGSLLSVKQVCSLGSLIMVHPGSYEYGVAHKESTFFWGGPSRREFTDVSFLGVEGSTILLYGVMFGQPGIVVFENLRIEIRYGDLRISHGAKVVFKNCTIALRSAVNIVIGESGSLEIAECRVTGIETDKVFEICRYASNVTIKRSEFQGFGLCALIPRTDRVSSGQMVEINVCHNVFHGMTDHAVIEVKNAGTEQMVFGTDRCTLSSNANGITGSETHTKLNTLHLITFHEPAPQPQVSFTWGQPLPQPSTSNTTSTFTFNSRFDWGRSAS